MATLTETAYYSRKIIKYGLTILIGLVIARGALIVGLRIYRQIFPPPPPPPTVKYGKLPKLPISSVANLPATITYTLETPDGTTIPRDLLDAKKLIPGQAKVFYMPKGNPSLLGLERAKQRAAAMGFGDEPELLENGIYRFTNKADASTLDIHSPTQSFHLSQVWQGKSGLLGNPPATTDAAITAVKNFLNNATALTDEIKDGIAKFKFNRADGVGLKEVSSISEADFVRVDLFRQDLEGLRVFTSIPKEGPVWANVAGAGTVQGQIIEIVFRYFPVEREEFSTYPIKTSLVAWQELGQGKGVIADLGGNVDGNVTIRRVYLGYLDVLTSALKFMQPVYVFEGDRDFAAYVPAVTDEWTR